MRICRFLLLASLCSLLASSALAAKRSKIECAKVSINKLQAGWGDIPAALQKLPPGANLCGTNAAGVAFILSELDTPALGKFYTPLFAAVGCKPLACKKDSLGQEQCSCPKANARGKVEPEAGYVLAQPYDQAYQLFFAEP
jgi:hypothetical protein